MKKNRASFFNEQLDYQQMSANNYNAPMQNPNMMPPQISAQSSFYAGVPNQMQNPNMNQLPYTNQNYMNNDIESKIAKIERQINRIEHRLSKLETTNTSTLNTDFDSNINDMYMI